MKRKYMWMGIASLILALGATAAYAKGHNGKMRGFQGYQLEALELTQDQKDRLKFIRTENQKRMIQLRADAQIGRVELRELMSQKSPSEIKVDKVLEKVNETRARITENRVKMKLSINKVLTDEQLQKLQEMPKRRRGGRSHFRERRGLHGGLGDPVGGWESVVDLPRHLFIRAARKYRSHSEAAPCGLASL